MNTNHTSHEIDNRITKIQNRVKELAEKNIDISSRPHIDIGTGRVITVQTLRAEIKKLKTRVNNLICEIEVDDFLRDGSSMQLCPEPA